MDTDLDLSLWSTDVNGLRIGTFESRPEGSIALHARASWVPLEQFFLRHGLTLWIVAGDDALRPPDDRERAPDGIVYRHPSAGNGPPIFKNHGTPTICPARTTDGQDVMIKVVSIGDDGTQHREALERLASGHTASLIGNHCVPVLRWITLKHIRFAVLPLLSFLDPLLNYAYENLGDLIETARQVLEALAFCHERLVAHLDVFPGNWLGNFIPGDDVERAFDLPVGERYKPFRSTFPYKVFLTDFECAVCFSPDSAPETRVVTGLPFPTYDRPLPPEMEMDVPYDPFAADVWQLGFNLSSSDFSNRVPAPLRGTFLRMRAPDPADRPTAANALRELTTWRDSLGKEELRAPVFLFNLA